MGTPGKIPGTFGDAFEEAPAVPFGNSNPMGSAAVPGRIPGTYGEGGNTPDPAPAVPFGSSTMNQEDPIPGTFGSGVCKPEWGKR